MKIKSVFIQRGLDNRTIIFDTKINLIYSTENSKGKTTLLRLILYGLGYNIPATDGVKSFDNFFVKIEYENDEIEYVIQRSQEKIYVSYKGEELTFIVPEQVEELHSVIFNIDDIVILNNLLAIFYIDQEKGWTLLNRGIIIGKNRFNIEEFVSSLSEKDISKINDELNKVKEEIKKYKYIKNIAEYKKNSNMIGISGTSKKNDLELYQKLNLLNIRKNEYMQEIEEVKCILKDNKKLMQYIEKMNICVKVSENSIIKLTENNILNYNENQAYYETRKKELEIRKTKIECEIKKIKNEIEDRNSLILSSKTVADEVDEMMRDVNIDEAQIDKILQQLSQKQIQLSNIVHDTIGKNNIYLESIFKTIRKYATELGIEEYIKDDYNFVLTNQLKGKSGKILTQMSFIFKIAYVLEIKKKYNVILPLIIDSPRTNEITESASTAMIKILERDFKDHQIILASVYNFEKIKTNIVEMKQNLFQ